MIFFQSYSLFKQQILLSHRLKFMTEFLLLENRIKLIHVLTFHILLASISFSDIENKRKLAQLIGIITPIYSLKILL